MIEKSIVFAIQQVIISILFKLKALLLRFFCIFISTLVTISRTKPERRFAETFLEIVSHTLIKILFVEKSEICQLETQSRDFDQIIRNIMKSPFPNLTFNKQLKSQVIWTVNKIKDLIRSLIILKSSKIQQSQTF